MEWKFIFTNDISDKGSIFLKYIKKSYISTLNKTNNLAEYLNIYFPKDVQIMHLSENSQIAPNVSAKRETS